MEPSRFDRLSDLFESARGLDPDARARLLAEVRAADAELARELAELLAEHDTGVTAELGIGPTPPVGAATGAADRDEDRPAGDQYELLQVIGEGGFGRVYLGQQKHPVRRQVAIKAIKPGMDSREVLARFDAERQALAILDHPHIAKVHDGGHTEQGRPFFVMEFVSGVPLTKFCDARRFDVRARIELLIAVCRGVQHAHQKGIVHRDLKPANILVTVVDGEPVPKVIDFGIAKALEQPLTAHTLATGAGRLIGTPEYMAPEQASEPASDVDTRADVYSLGVMLYELVAGSPPLDLSQQRRAGSYVDLLRAIRDVEPVRPSLRAATNATSADSEETARLRGVTVVELVAELRGDLDWICAKALEKDRERRYQSPAELAADLQRYLDGFEVEARPPTFSYRLQKFVRRNRAAVAFAAVVATLLIAGIGGTTYGMIQAWDAAAAVEEQAYLGVLAYTDSALRGGDREAAESLLQDSTPHPERFEYAALQARVAPTWRAIDLPTAEGAVFNHAFGSSGRRLLRLVEPAAAVDDGLLRAEVFTVADDGSAVELTGSRLLPFVWNDRPLVSEDGAWVWSPQKRFVHAMTAGGVDFDAGEGRMIIAVDPGRDRVFTIESAWEDDVPDRAVRAQSLRTGADLWPRAVPAPIVHLGVVSPNGRWLAINERPSAASEAQFVRLLDAATGERLGRLDVRAVVGIVSFSADSRWLLGANTQTVVGARLDDPDPSTLELEFEVPLAARSASFLDRQTTPDGAVLIMPSGTEAAPRLSFLDLDSRIPLDTLDLAPNVPAPHALSGDGAYVLAMAADGNGVLRWQLATQLALAGEVGRQQAVAFPERDDSPRRAIAVHPRSRELAVGLGSAAPFHRTEARLYDLVTRAPILDLWSTQTAANSRALAYSPDGRELASFGLVSTFPEITRPGPRPQLRSSTITVYDHGTGVQRWCRIVGLSPAVASAEDATPRWWAWPDVRYHGTNGRVYLWGGSSSPYAQVESFAAQDGAIVEPLVGHTDAVHDLDVLKDGTIVTAGADVTIRFWSADSHRELEGRRIAAPDGPVYEVLAAHPNAPFLIAAVLDSPDLHVIDHRNGELVRVLRGHAQRTTDLAFSVDGARMASAGFDGVVRIWRTVGDDPARWLQLLSFGGGQPVVAGVKVRFTPDAKRLVHLDRLGRIEVVETTAAVRRAEIAEVAVAPAERRRRDAAVAGEFEHFEARLLPVAQELHLRACADPDSWPGSLAEARLGDGALLDDVQRDLVRGHVQLLAERRRVAEDGAAHVNGEAWMLCRFEGVHAAGAEAALAAMNRVIGTEPDDADYENTRGMILLRLGRFSEARTALERAHRRHRDAGGRDPAFLLHVAIARARCGDQVGAREALQAAESRLPAESAMDPQTRTFLAEARAVISR